MRWQARMTFASPSTLTLWFSSGSETSAAAARWISASRSRVALSQSAASVMSPRDTSIPRSTKGRAFAADRAITA